MLFYYLLKYILVLSIAIVGTAIRSLLLKGPNKAVLGPFDPFWPA